VGLVLFGITILVNGLGRLVLMRIENISWDELSMTTYDRYRQWKNNAALLS